ncbi:TrbI/VirB10 family protein (plasmid) [Pantoea sp. BJ2]|uniref:TrbI/VirB10 family protein n=1 Tax=Pantoea sp. BJ2 TaxID=3141322 RepID=A0AAU7U471_9GAMM
MNLNSLVRSKQRRLFAIILAAAAVIIGGLYLANKSASGHAMNKAGKPDKAAAEPDLTGGGVVRTFDGSGQGSLLVSAQNREKEAREQLTAMQKDFKSLKDQMSDVMNNNKSLQQNVGDLMEQLKNQQNQQKAPPAGQTPPRTEYAFAPAPVQAGQIDNQTFDYSQFEPKAKDTSFWVPTGTFSDAIVIEGADANASVRGENNLVPMQFKLKGRAHMPGNKKMVQLDNCFVTAAAYGDISSERAIVQLQRLSCIIDGKHVDQAVKGHVAFYGKNGIKGVPVMRNGKILGLAYTAGALGGLGQSASQVGQTVTGIGATSTLSAGDVARGAVGGGVGKAADKLADYYIERAEQYHPIIPIGAANRVEVVFIEGFRAKFIEDEEALKLAKEEKRNGTQQQDTQTREQGNSGLPPDLVGKLGDATRLNVNDFVTPTNGGQARSMTPQGVAQ